MRKSFVAPSLLSADPKDLRGAALLARDSGCRYIHFDVMDGKFVENKSFSPEDFQEITGIEGLVYDVHLMAEDPLALAKEYAKLGADIVTFHLEAAKDPEYLKKAARELRGLGIRPGISIKPRTPVGALRPYLGEFGLVLLMSVEPGKGGQSFIPESLPRVSELRKLIGERDILLEIDGGINDVTGKAAFERGADILVAGSYLYGHPDFSRRVESLCFYAL